MIGDVKRNPSSRIYKYPLMVHDEVTIMMPAGANVLCVQTQGGQAQVWAVVDAESAYEPRTFYVVGTGHPMPRDAGRYVGTFQLEGGSLVFHVFESAGTPKERKPFRLRLRKSYDWTGGNEIWFVPESDRRVIDYALGQGVPVEIELADAGNRPICWFNYGDGKIVGGEPILQEEGIGKGGTPFWSINVTRLKVGGVKVNPC